MIFVTQDTNHIVVPWRDDLATLIPHHRELAFRGERMLVMPNRHDEAKLARNLGVPVPAPILTRYSWPRVQGNPPWEIQKVTAALLTESPRAYVLNTMGTGKTRSTLFACDYLRQSGAVRRVLIAAPLSTLTPVWESEIFAMLPRATTVVLHGSRQKRLQLLKSDAEYYVVNHHGLKMLQDDLIKRGFDIVVIDELAVFRNKSTELWKALNGVLQAPSVQYAWGLTGSPTPNEPTDAWAQVRLLTPGKVPRSMTQFRDLTMRQITTFKWVARPNALDVVHQAMQPSVRFTRDDVMELPETTWVDRDVKLSTEGARAYKLLFDKMRMQTQAGQSITAVNEGVLQNKLLQVACGYLYDDKGQVYALPNNDRLDVCLELVEEADRKVIVFVPYVHALQGIVEHLVKHKQSVAMVHGGTSLAARNKIFRDFQEAAEPRVLVAHPQCMAHGLTLTAANTIIWFCPTNSLETYEQANARITRPGQKSKTLIVHLGGTQVEKQTYRRLREKGKMQGILLDMFHTQQLEY